MKIWICYDGEWPKAWESLEDFVQDKIQDGFTPDFHESDIRNSTAKYRQLTFTDDIGYSIEYKCHLTAVNHS